MADARPTCPDCDIKGIEYIVSTPSTETSEGGDPWFNVAHCNQCGHVYGIFAKTVNRPAPVLPGTTIPYHP